MPPVAVQTPGPAPAPAPTADRTVTFNGIDGVRGHPTIILPLVLPHLPSIYSAF